MKILYFVILICLLLITPAQGDTLKIGECADCDSSIAQDTRLHEGDHNNGGALHVNTIGWIGASELRSIYKFLLDQEELSGATITAATFGCYVSNIGAGGNPNIEIHEIAAANLGWVEGTKAATTAGAGEPDWSHFSHTGPVTTWAGSAGLSTPTTDYVVAAFGSFSGTSTGAKNVPLNAAAITYLNSKIGDKADFLLFTPDSFFNNRFTQIRSSEWTTASERPYLELTYIPAGATTVYISDQGGSHVGSCEDNGMFSVSTINAYNLNLGASAEIFIGSSAIGSGGSTRIIQRYDISSIPDVATIHDVEIIMEATAISGSGDTVSLYQIATANNDWVEGTADGATQSGSSCWNDFAWENITEWAGSAGLSTATTDYINTKLASDQAISTTGTKTFTLNAAGIAAVQGQLSDNDFEVIFYNLTTTVGNFITFASSENGTTAFRPYLKIIYTLPAPSGQARVLIIRR